jgi:hypothetical protein
MDLKEFIKQTISGIVEATSELQQETDCAVINPPVAPSVPEFYREGSERHTYRRVEAVEFDVAVTAASESGGGGKIGLKILSAEAGVDGKHDRRNEEVSRVKFSISIALPPSFAEDMNRRASEERARLQKEKMQQRSTRASWLE